MLNAISATKYPIINKSNADSSWWMVSGVISENGDDICGVEYVYQKSVRPDSTAANTRLLIGFKKGDPFLNRKGEACARMTHLGNK